MLAGGGAVFLWSGIKGLSWTGVLRNILAGKNPTAGLTQTSGISSLSVTGTGNQSATASGSYVVSGGSAEGEQIANTALGYKGHAYVYGGAPGPNGDNPWDCSSFCNYVLATQLHIPIPGGAYNPSTHGPATTSYLGFGVGVQANQVEAGDLCVSSTHMGIAINNTQMISALNPSLTTEVTGIANGMPSGESVVYRRVFSG